MEIFNILLEMGTIVIGAVAIANTFYAARCLCDGMLKSYILWVGNALMVLMIPIIFHFFISQGVYMEQLLHASGFTLHLLYHVSLIASCILFCIGSCRVRAISNLYTFKKTGANIDQAVQKHKSKEK